MCIRDRVRVGRRRAGRLRRERRAGRLDELDDEVGVRLQVVEVVVAVGVRRRGLARGLAIGREQIDGDPGNRSLALILLAVAVDVPPDVVTDGDQIDLEVGLGVVVGCLLYTSRCV